MASTVSELVDVLPKIAACHTTAQPAAAHGATRQLKSVSRLVPAAVTAGVSQGFGS